MMKAYYYHNNVGIVVEYGAFWRIFNGYSKKQACDMFKKEYRKKLGVKKLPYKMTFNRVESLDSIRISAKI